MLLAASAVSDSDIALAIMIWAEMKEEMTANSTMPPISIAIIVSERVNPLLIVLCPVRTCTP